MQEAWGDQWADPHWRFLRSLQMQRLKQLLENSEELKELRHQPEKLKTLERLLKIALEETKTDLMVHILRASEPPDTLDEKSQPPQQLVAGLHDTGGRVGGRELHGVELRLARPHKNKVGVLPARFAADKPPRRFGHHDAFFHFTPYDRFKLYKDSRSVKHWAPDLTRTLRTRYLHRVPLPTVLRVLLSRFVWKWGTLAQMLARELFGHHIDSDEPEMFWPNQMVHGNY